MTNRNCFDPNHPIEPRMRINDPGSGMGALVMGSLLAFALLVGGLFMMFGHDGNTMTASYNTRAVPPSATAAMPPASRAPAETTGSSATR